MQHTLRLLCLSVLTFLTDSAPANDTTTGDGIIEITAGVLDNSVIDTIALPAAFDAAAAGIDVVDTGNQVDAVATGDQVDAVATGNQGDAVASGNQGDAVATGNQVDAVATGNQGDAVASGNQGDAVATGNQVDAVATGNQIDTAATGNQADPVATGNQVDAVATGNQIDAAATGNQADPVATGNQVDAVANGNQGDAVATDNQVDVGATGNQADVVVNGDQVGATAIGTQSGVANVIADLEGAGIPPAHNIDTTGSGLNTETAGANLIKDTDALFPGPYVTVEEVNSDHEKLHDTAICEKCNPDITVRNSCFLKHPRDCRKYIHCIHQKETWTAFNMRCSFGTFWSDEYNTCQFSHMVDCRTDVCRNPALTSYDNGGLNDNCRAFWSCEGGYSVPMCCEKYSSYRSGQCVPDNNCTTECPDPCQNTDITSYGNEINCRNFYECNDKKSKSFCCAVGQSFMNGTCVDDDVCDMPCPVDAILLDRQEVTATTYQPSPNPSCSYEVVGTGSFQSIGNTNKYHIMPCPGNLVFSVQKCTCDFPTTDVLDTLPRECKPEVCVDFEKDINPAKVPVKNHDVKISSGRGQFNGESFLAIPMYSYNERFSKKMNIKMLFKSKSGMGQDRQVLLSNCRTVITTRSSRLSPSLAIIIDKSVGKHYVIFLGTTKDNGNASIAHTFQPGQWTSLELVFDGQRLTASTKTIDYDTGASIESQFDTKELAGELKKGLESLKIGKCLARDGFHGEMDDICIGDCLNGKFSGSPAV